MNGAAHTRVIAIDVGYRNMGVCHLTADQPNKPHLWQVFDLWHAHRHKGTPSTQDLVQVTRRWCDIYQSMLQRADAIVLESQMRTPFHVMNAVINTLYPDKCVYYDARTVGRFWHLPAKRAPKKIAGVETARMNKLQFPDVDKEDDLADAWLMASYHLCQSKSLPTQALIFLPAPVKKRR